MDKRDDTDQSGAEARPRAVPSSNMATPRVRSCCATRPRPVPPCRKRPPR